MGDVLGVRLFAHQGEQLRCSGCRRLLTLLSGPGTIRCPFCRATLVSLDDIMQLALRRREGRPRRHRRPAWHPVQRVIVLPTNDFDDDLENGLAVSS